MNKKLLDLYSDYLISSFSQVTATGLSTLLEGAYSHDQITRFLGQKPYDGKAYWQLLKPVVRQIEHEAGVLVVDDTIEAKPYTDESELVCWHYDHSQGRRVKGMNILTFVYHTPQPQGAPATLPVAYEVVTKPEQFQDPKTNRWKRRSQVTKNELVRQRLKILSHTNQLSFKYVLTDIWFSSKDNMNWLKLTLGREFVMALKGNRLVALSDTDKRNGQFVPLSELDWNVGQTRQVYLKGIAFPVVVTRQRFTNQDGSTGILYLVSSDTSLSYFDLITIYQKR